jgi:hypothetical protein
MGTGIGTDKGKVLLYNPQEEKACIAVEMLQGARRIGHRGLTRAGIIRPRAIASGVNIFR